MKIIAYSHQSTPLHVQAGDSQVINLTINADGGADMQVAYIVLMGYDDVTDLSDDYDLPARIIDHLQQENADLRKRVEQLVFIEQVALRQGEELERLRT